MSTARDIIEGAMRLIGAISNGENATSSELADGLSALNDMIDDWSTNSLAIYTITKEEFTLTVGKQVYTMGSGGDFDTTRPVKINNVNFKKTGSINNYENPIEILTNDEWSEISVKETQSTIPTKVYPDYQNPLCNLYFWPVPSEANKAVINSEKVIKSFASASDDVELPPGYNKALKYNLAMDIAPEYGVEPSPRVERAATVSLGNLKRRNSKPKFLKCDAVTTGQKSNFNWRTGE